MRLIDTLEQYSGLLTFLITFVYAVTTLFIMQANKKAADATLEQVQESRRQFAELNRPRLVVAFVHDKHNFCGLRIINEGQRMAEHVHIDLDDAFLESITSARIKEALLRQENGECAIGAGQHFDLPLGTAAFKDPNKPLLLGTVYYSSNSERYSHDFSVVWDDINLQDKVEEARAALYLAQAQQISEKTKGATENENP